MNENSLPITSGTGTQGTTQNPQTAGGSTGAGTSAKSVQPGTAPASLETQTQGLPLTGQNLTTISLPQNSGTVVPTAPQSSQSTNALPGVSAVFFLIAVGIIIAIFLPSKNTTK